MKKLIITILAVMGGFLSALYAQETAVDKKSCSIVREGKSLKIGLDLDLSDTEVKSNRMVIFTPIVDSNAKFPHENN